MILLHFFSLLFTTALFILKMVVSIAVKSTRKILYPSRLFGTKLKENFVCIFLRKIISSSKIFLRVGFKEYDYKDNYIIL